MKILPDLNQVKEIAKTGVYKVLPVSCELLSDCCTPIEALRILKNVSFHCYLLESVTEKEKWGRYTFLGFDPRLEITCIDGKLKAGNIEMETDNPSALIRQILEDYKSPRREGLPSFTGGLVGYFSYDYLGYREPAVLPAGTLSGAPKIRACQLIGQLENNKRGIYGGAIGYIDFTGNMDTCIAIRIAYKKNGKVFIRSGTADCLEALGAHRRKMQKLPWIF